MPDIGTAIKKIRQASDKPLAEVAKEAGISVPLLSQIENGKRNPSLEVIGKLSEALRIPAEALYIFAMPKTLKLRTGDSGVTALARSLTKLAEAELALKREIVSLEEGFK